MKVSVSNHIYTALSSDPDITKAVGKNIYPIATKSEVKFPFIVYEKENLTPNYNKLGVESVNIDESIYILAETYSEAEQIAEMVVRRLDRYKPKYDDYEIINAIVTDIPESYVSQTFVQQVRMTFTVK
jgi:hypothetical protein